MCKKHFEFYEGSGEDAVLLQRSLVDHEFFPGHKILFDPYVAGHAGFWEVTAMPTIIIANGDSLAMVFLARDHTIKFPA